MVCGTCGREVAVGVEEGIAVGDRVCIAAPVGTDDQGTVLHRSPEGGVGYKSTHGGPAQYLDPQSIRWYRTSVHKAP